MDLVEIDGTYPGCPCNNGSHHQNKDKETDPSDPNDTTTGKPSKYKIHYGYHDSIVKQWENSVRMMNKEFRDMNVYIKVPDWYYLSGGNKGGIGYEEVAWSQPRKEQLIYGRQIIHNSTYLKPASMSWSHIPFVQYHGGGSSAAFIPFSQNIEDYDWVLAQNLGNGVTSDYRGNSLYDAGSLSVMKKWVNFYKKYRGIVDSDMIKISQATYAAGSNRQTTTKLDTLYHANAQNEGEKGLLWVYNQSNEPRTETIKVPMYYTGLTNMPYPQVPVKGSLGKDVKSYNTWPPDYSWLPDQEANYVVQAPAQGVSTGQADFLREGIQKQSLSIDANGDASLKVTLPPMSFTYYLIYEEGASPNVDVEVGQVSGLQVTNVTGSKASLAWTKDVSIQVTLDGQTLENHGMGVSKYNVYRDGALIGQSINAFYEDTGLDEETSYSYEVEAVVGEVKGTKSQPVVAVTNGDMIAPEILAVSSTTSHQINIIFDEPIDEVTGENEANYAVDPSVTIIDAVVKGSKVTLEVAPLAPLTSYEVKVNGVKDKAVVPNVCSGLNKTFTYGYLRYYPLEMLKNNTSEELTINQEMNVYNGQVVDSVRGKAIQFNSGSKTYGDLGSGYFDQLSSYGLGLWVKSDGSNKQILLSQGQDEVAMNDFTLYLEDRVPKFRISNSDGSIVEELVSQEAMSVDGWHHILLTKNQDTITLYMDGVKVAEQEQADIKPAFSNTLYLGAITNNAGGDRTLFFDGLMKEVKLYFIGLDDQGVLGEYGNTPLPTDLNATWKNLSVRNGIWSINSRGEIVAPNTNKDEVLIQKELQVSSGTVQGKILLGDHDNQKQGFVIGWGNDTSDGSKQQGYQVFMERTGTITLHKSGTGDLGKENFEVDMTKWIDLKVAFSNDNIRIYVNDELKITYEDSVNIVGDSYVGLFSVIYPHVTGFNAPKYKGFTYSNHEQELQSNWANLSVKEGQWVYNSSGEFVAPVTQKDEVLIYKNNAHNQGTVTCEVLLGSEDGQSQGQVIGWGNDTSDSAKQQGYEILLTKTKVKLHKSGTGDLATGDVTLTEGQWVNLKTIYQDGSIQIFVDGEMKINYTNQVNIHDDSYAGFFAVIYPYKEDVSGPRFRNFTLKS